MRSLLIGAQAACVRFKSAAPRRLPDKIGIDL